jgi:hypothetical protein
MFMKFCFLILSLLLFTSFLEAQTFKLSGQVTDAGTGENLAFVNIIINQGVYGGTTDIDGKFSITSNEIIQTLKLSFVGYHSLEIKPEADVAFQRLSMEPKVHTLDEVTVLPGENPAHRIINLAFQYADSNNPQKLPAFRYKAYDKIVFTVDTNQITGTTGKKNNQTEDLRLGEFLSQRDLFLMETVTERSYITPGQTHEKVLASRMSGFSDPVLVFLISQLQSTDFYDEMIRISDKNYINPISRGSTRKYLFILQDSHVTETGDSVFMISFRPMLNTNFDGLQGIININSDNWAIQNVQAQPYRQEKGLSISIQQLYEKIEGRQWFPVQLQTDIQFNDARLSDGNKTHPLFVSGKSYLRNIELSPQFINKDFNHIALEINKGELQRDAAWWIGQRIDSLTARDMETYRYLDSIGRVARLDRLAGGLASLMQGRLPVGIFEIELNRLFRYNDFEGFYTGLGLKTGPGFSNYFTAGGYWGYSFGDQRAKYGIGLGLSSPGRTQAALRLSYDDAAEESGHVKTWDDLPNPFNEQNYRLLFINRMDYSRRLNAGFSIRALQHAEWRMGLSSETRTTTYNYFFGNQNEAVPENQQYRFTNLHAGVRFAFNEKFMQTERGLVSMGTKFPLLSFTYTRGLTSIGSDYEYNKFDLQLDYSFYKAYWGKTSISAQMGLIEGSLPYPVLYNSPSSWRSLALFAPNSFATMRMNEFVSDRHVYIFLSHDFGKLLIRKSWFEPSVVLHTNIAYGSLSHPETHHFIDIKAPDHGYYESGILLRNLVNLPLTKLGAGLFYRYGPYGFKKSHENIGYKISMSLGI